MKVTEQAVRDAELAEAAQKYHPKGKISVESGAIIEEGEPTNTVNLLVRLDEIDALAQTIKAARGSK